MPHASDPVQLSQNTITRLLWDGDSTHVSFIYLLIAVVVDVVLISLRCFNEDRKVWEKRATDWHFGFGFDVGSHAALFAAAPY